MPRILSALIAGFVAWFPIRLALSLVLSNTDNAGYFSVVGAIIAFAIVSGLLLKAPANRHASKPVEAPPVGGAFVATLAVGTVEALTGRREDEAPLTLMSVRFALPAPHWTLPAPRLAWSWMPATSRSMLVQACSHCMHRHHELPGIGGPTSR